MEADDLTDHTDLFKEPDDFFQPEKPATFANHRLRNGNEIHLRLVGHNPLWGHLLWNAGRIIAQYLEENAHALITERTVLELGAGAGLPSLVCAIHGAKKVVVTDYPDLELVENLHYNIEHCELIRSKESIVAEGFLWGSAATGVKSHLERPEEGFDLLILADILFNHSEHKKLVVTVQETLKKQDDACALVFFTPYRPWLLENDLEFFELAAAAGFLVQKILESTMDNVMFENDPGDEALRRTVFGYRLKWNI